MLMPVKTLAEMKRLLRALPKDAEKGLENGCYTPLLGTPKRGGGESDPARALCDAQDQASAGRKGDAPLLPGVRAD